jgi:hypothetical protein
MSIVAEDNVPCTDRTISIAVDYKNNSIFTADGNSQEKALSED